MGFGSASTVGNGARPAGPVAAIVSTPGGGGYWTASANGAVTAEGDAVNYGSLAGITLSAPVVGMAATADGGGYWLVASDGGIFAFGDAVFHGSMGGHRLDAPVVGMAATADGGGYWEVASDGGIFAFGDAVFHGSMGGHRLDEPMVGMAPTADGGGYWTVASDGGIFAFGDAVFHGSMGGQTLDEPMVGMAADTDGGGYWMVAADGGIFSFGDAPFVGSGTGGSVEAPAVGLAPRPGGYWVAYGQTAARIQCSRPTGASGHARLSPAPMVAGRLRVALVPAGHVEESVGSGDRHRGHPGGHHGLRGARGAPPRPAPSRRPRRPLLEGAAADPTAGANPAGYTYAVANENLPETLSVWHNGALVMVTAANTGGPGAATAQGTFPVYERLRAQIMTGTDPDGAHYADPVQYVAYFNGSDAVHYIARASYGSPQSLGCVELPLGSGRLCLALPDLREPGDRELRSSAG